MSRSRRDPSRIGSTAPLAPARGIRRRLGSAGAWLLLLLLAWPQAPGWAAQSLTILHTSEHHGTALPLERRGEPSVAGMAPRATLIEAVRQEAGELLLVDSGDILIGSALSSIFRGKPDVEAMNLMAYDAMAAGNHEFDYGLAHAARLVGWARFPVLCSNLRAAEGSLPCRESAIVRVGQVRVGLVGLLGLRNFPDSFNREVVKALSLDDPIETVRTLARRLKETHAVDLVVALTHQETPEDLELMASAPEIDVIIGGHTTGFDGLRSARVEGPVDALDRPGTVFVKTHRQGRTVGRLDLVIERNTDGRTVVQHARARNLTVTAEVDPHPKVATLLEGYRLRMEEEAGAVVGEVLVHLDGASERVRSRETNLGNLLADLLRSRFGTDVALINGGLIRASIPPGPLTLRDVLTVLPFDSTTVTFTVTGEHLRQALEHSVSRLPSLTGRFLQVSGLTVRYDLAAPPGRRVREVRIGGVPLDASRDYTVATDSFLAEGGDGYTMFRAARDLRNRELPVRDLLLAAARRGPLSASPDGRIRFAGSSRRGPPPIVDRPSGFLHN